jgi:hypothetical protein
MIAPSDDRESDERKGDGRNKQRSCDHGDREDDKKKKKGQLANKPRERRGVRRTSHMRRELCELKRRGRAGRAVVSTDDGSDLRADRDPSASEAPGTRRMPNDAAGAGRIVVLMTTSINRRSERVPTRKRQTPREQRGLRERA